jgi:hypothetical protein
MAMEPFVPFVSDDLELVKRYERLSVNLARLLSQIFTNLAIDFKISILRSQDYKHFRGWHFKFKEHRCWYGISFASATFLRTRFQILVDGDWQTMRDGLKAKGYAELTWNDKGPWLAKEQPTDALNVTSRDEQITLFTAIVTEHLNVVEGLEFQAPGSLNVIP